MSGKIRPVPELIPLGLLNGQLGERTGLERPALSGCCVKPHHVQRLTVCVDLDGGAIPAPADDAARSESC